MKLRRIEMGILLVSLVSMSAVAIVRATPEMDHRIELSAKNTYVFKTYLKEDSIDVDSNNGVVTLSGTVSSSSHKSLAKGTVESLPGVTKVKNKIIINGRGDARNQDGWIATKVKTNLMIHRNVNAFYTQVRVVDGAVTLQGEAETSAQRDLTTEYAKDIDGVKSVRNEMTVGPQTSNSANPPVNEIIDDASITAQVKMALLYNSSTSALNTRVKTNDGVVRLSGNAKNSAERDLVTKLVSNINGVSTVENHMTVSPRT